MPSLVPATKNRDPVLRLHAVEALGRMTPLVSRLSPGHQQALLAALKDSDARVRLHAIRALCRPPWPMDEPHPEIRPLLFDADVSVRVAAIEALTRDHRTDETITMDLDRCAHDPQPTVRRAALVAWADSPAPEVRELLARLGDNDSAVRAAVMTRLAETEEKRPPSPIPVGFVPRKPLYPLLVNIPHAGEALRAALDDTDNRVRIGALEALTVLPGDAADLPRLLRCLRDEAPNIRQATASALGHLGKAAEEALPALFERLDDAGETSSEKRLIPWRARVAIESICPREAPRAYARLVDLLDDPRSNVRAAAFEALSSLDPPLIRWFCERLADPTSPESQRKAIVELLSNERLTLVHDDARTPIEGLKTDVIVPALRRFVEDLEADDELRNSALMQLTELERDPKARTRLVLDVHGRMRLRVGSRVHLREYDAGNSTSLLAEGLRSPDPEIRTVAAYLVEQARSTQPGDEPVPLLTGRLIALLDDPVTQVRWAAASALDSPSLKPPYDGQAIAKLRFVVRDRTSRLSPGSWYFGPFDRSIGLPVTQIAGTATAPLLRTIAAESVGRFQESPSSVFAVPELVDATTDADPLVRRAAVEALRMLGEKATSAASALRHTLAESGDLVGLPFDQEESVQDSQGGPVRRGSADALGSLGEAARPAVPALIRAADDLNPSVRVKAIRALGELS
ncbi:HEAT repeat domain-containing protein, partial [Aquisphaera insulae]|uniref:HEAT repeat domain-containing protein n=1 Tax=Aquisphaera insulae TaxID=2712864 RepID=UPI00202DED44